MCIRFILPFQVGLVAEFRFFFLLNISIRQYSSKLKFCKECMDYLRFCHPEILQFSMADVSLRLYRMPVPFTFKVDL